MNKPEQISLFNESPVLDLTPKRNCCWRYSNGKKCWTKDRCKEWTRRYDANGNRYNCAEMFRCGTCEDCETPSKKYFSGECEHLDEWKKIHGEPWREDNG